MSPRHTRNVRALAVVQGTEPLFVTNRFRVFKLLFPFHVQHKCLKPLFSKISKTREAASSEKARGSVL